MKPVELRGLTDGELQTKLDEAYEEMMNLRFNMSIGQQKDHSRLPIVKREIARLRTILNERRIAAEMK